MDKPEQDVARDLLNNLHALDMACVGMHVPSLTVEMLAQMRKVIGLCQKQAEWLSNREIK